MRGTMHEERTPEEGATDMECHHIPDEMSDDARSDVAIDGGSSESKGGVMRHLSGRNGAITLGLAASSLAMIAGRTPTPSHTETDSAVAPASENAEVKQVKWDLERRPGAENDRVEFF